VNSRHLGLAERKENWVLSLWLSMMFVNRLCSTLRVGLFRRSMATAGRRPDTPERMTTFHQVAAFTAIFCGVLGPGIVLMLTREKPLSEH